MHPTFKIWLVTLGLALVVAGSGAAFAQRVDDSTTLRPDIPNFDVDGRCDPIKNGLQEPAWVAHACVSDEQSAYELLKMQWPQARSADLVYCIRAASPSPRANYQLLETCVSGAIANHQYDAEPPPFHY